MKRRKFLKSVFTGSAVLAVPAIVAGGVPIEFNDSIKERMEKAWLECKRNPNKPNIILCDPQITDWWKTSL